MRLTAASHLSATTTRNISDAHRAKRVAERLLPFLFSLHSDVLQCCNEIGQWCHVLFLPCYILLLHGYVYDALTCLMKVPFSASQSLQPIEIKLAKCACVPLHSQQCKGHSREQHTLFTAIPNRTERVQSIVSTLR